MILGEDSLGDLDAGGECETDDSRSHYSAEDSSDSEEEGDLPAIVARQMERRERELDEGKPLAPPSREVVDALRSHFLAGNDEVFHGGFVDCMEKIGATPKSDDELVYAPDYNCVVFGDASKERAEEETISHEARVRLLRYREYVDCQASRGCAAGEGWRLSDDEDFVYNGTEVGRFHALDDDDVLTSAQVLAFGAAFANGFYYYARMDDILAGQGVGFKVGGEIPGHLRNLPSGLAVPFQVDLNEGTLLGQCEDLENRYDELRCPLGPKSVLTRDSSASTRKEEKKRAHKKKGKKGRGKKDSDRRSEEGANKLGVGFKSHREEIRARLAALLESIGLNLLPSSSTAFMVKSMADVISAACVDPDVALALVDDDTSKCGSRVLELRDRSLVLAKSSPTDTTNWWGAHAQISAILWTSGGSFAPNNRKASNADRAIDSSQAKFFSDELVPALLPSMDSTHPFERGVALKTFAKALGAVPRSKLLKLIAEKRVWAIVERACRVGLDDCGPKSGDAAHSTTAMTGTWEDFAKHFALRQAAVLIRELSSRAFVVDRGTNQSSGDVTPTKLANKMVARGIVPLLMEIAKAGVGSPSIEALNALGDISRTKDCRTLILQDEGSLEVIRTVTSSTDGSAVSPALLLVSHLLWDREWIEPISTIGLVDVCIRWTLFVFDAIIKRAEEKKKSQKELRDRYLSLSVQAFRTQNEEERGRLLRMANELNGRLGHKSWLDLESDDHRSSLDFFLLRCLLCLSISVTLPGGADLLLERGALPLFAACLDIPIGDSWAAAGGGVYNATNKLGIDRVSPSVFRDPAHLVRSAVTVMHRRAESRDADQKQIKMAIYLVVLLHSRGEWRPYFDCLPEPLKTVVSVATDRFGSIMLQPRPPPSESSPRSINADINEKCATHTGKLLSCSNCGKMEAKQGDMKVCSKCNTAIYCSKECQLENWRNGHKVICKKLRKKSRGAGRRES